jgi:hypothetical protein
MTKDLPSHASPGNTPLHRALMTARIEMKLVLHLAPVRHDMGRARRAERILHALWDVGIVAEQNAGEQQGLRSGRAGRLHDGILARLERTPRKRDGPAKRRKALIAPAPLHVSVTWANTHQNPDNSHLDCLLTLSCSASGRLL